MGSAERPTDDGPVARGEVHLRSRDPVEASALAARVYNEHRLTVVGDRRAFAMTLDAASLGPITLGWLLYDTEIRVDAEPHPDAYRINLISAGQMQTHPLRNFVESCLGGDPILPEMTLSPRRALQPGDVLLVCTDGFWSGLEDAFIGGAFRGADTPMRDALRSLASLALKNAGEASDNTSAAALRFLD